MESPQERFSTSNKIDFYDHSERRRKEKFNVHTFRQLRLAIDHSSPDRIDEDKQYQ